MPLELTDFDQAGLDVDALALIVAAAPPNIYADSDRGGTQTPEAGDIGIGAGETRISRIGILESGATVRLNDNDNPEALALREYFGASGTISAWTLYIQTDDGVASSSQLGNTGGGYANYQFGVNDAVILNAIAAGDRFIVAFAQATAAAATKPIAATFAGIAGSLSAALTKQARAAKPVAVTFPGTAGSLSVALSKVVVRQPMAALAASETIIERGRSVELRWAASDVVSASIEPGVGPVDPAGGSIRVRPTEATTYILTIRGALGTIPATSSVTVTVRERAQRSLLPLNRTALERGMEIATDRPVDVPIRHLWSAADCPVALLPYLAWALGGEDWDSDWPEAVKREAVSTAFAIHREKGTLAGLKRLLENAGADYEYEERPQGVPMTAILRIFNSNTVFLPDITAAIGRVKRASLDLDMELWTALGGRIPIAGGLGAATVVEISDWTGYAV